MDAAPRDLLRCFHRPSPLPSAQRTATRPPGPSCRAGTCGLTHHHSDSLLAASTESRRLAAQRALFVTVIITAVAPAEHQGASAAQHQTQICWRSARARPDTVAPLRALRDRPSHRCWQTLRRPSSFAIPLLIMEPSGTTSSAAGS